MHKEGPIRMNSMAQPWVLPPLLPWALPGAVGSREGWGHPTGNLLLGTSPQAVVLVQNKVWNLVILKVTGFHEPCLSKTTGVADGYGFKLTGFPGNLLPLDHFFQSCLNFAPLESKVENHAQC